MTQDSVQNSAALTDFQFLVSVREERARQGKDALPSENMEGVETHGKLPWDQKEVVTEKAEKVLEDWRKRVDQMKALIGPLTEGVTTSLQVDTVSFSLSFNAKASAWIFAEVGGECTVEVTFKHVS